MKTLVMPSVISTCWKDDFELFGFPKHILFDVSKRFTNHIGIYDLTIQKFAKLANRNNKKKTNES
jgi:hypothetical protein